MKKTKDEHPIFYFFMTYGWFVFLLIFLNEKYGYAVLTMMMESDSKIIGFLLVPIATFLGVMIVPTIVSLGALFFRIKEAIFPKED